MSTPLVRKVANTIAITHGQHWMDFSKEAEAAIEAVRPPEDRIAGVIYENIWDDNFSDKRGVEREQYLQVARAVIDAMLSPRPEWAA
jgi:hypothetical protein